MYGRFVFFSWLNFNDLQLLNDDNRHSPLHLLASDASMQIRRLVLGGRFLNQFCSVGPFVGDFLDILAS